MDTNRQSKELRLGPNVTIYGYPFFIMFSIEARYCKQINTTHVIYFQNYRKFTSQISLQRVLSMLKMYTTTLRIVHNKNNCLLGGWWETCSAMKVTLFCDAQGTGPSAAKSYI